MLTKSSTQTLSFVLSHLLVFLGATDFVFFQLLGVPRTYHYIHAQTRTEENFR